MLLMEKELRLKRFRGLGSFGLFSNARCSVNRSRVVHKVIYQKASRQSHQM